MGEEGVTSEALRGRGCKVRPKPVKRGSPRRAVGPQEWVSDLKMRAEKCWGFLRRRGGRAAAACAGQPFGMGDVLVPFALSPQPWVGAAPPVLYVRVAPENGNLFLSRKLRTMETGLSAQEASLPTVGFLCQSSETVNTKYRKS